MIGPHLIDGLDRVVRPLGGLTRTWRFDRMARVLHAGAGNVTVTFPRAANTR